MKLLAKIQKYVTGRSVTNDLCLQTIRFRELLEKTQALMHLIDDGQEKLSEEYILDFHYIAALIENITQSLGVLVFNACVLVPEGGEALYISLDGHREKARNMLLTATLKPARRNPPENPGTSVWADPEYELLKDVLAWCHKEKGDLESSVTGFVSQIFNHVMAGPHPLLSNLGEMPARNIISGAITNRINTIDLFEGIYTFKPLPSENIECLPLRLMELGASTGRTDGKEGNEFPTRHWIAVVDDQHLSLRMIIGSDLIIRIEASVTGHLNSDYIFVYSKNHINPESILPKGFRIQKSQYGQLAWNFDMLEKIIEDDLVLLGSNIFCNILKIF